MKLAILILFVFFVYRIVRKGLRSKDYHRSSWTGTDKTGQQSDGFEEMVEDPYCHTFVQKSRAVKGRKSGKTYYFCSEQCKSKYLKE